MTTLNGIPISEVKTSHTPVVGPQLAGLSRKVAIGAWASIWLLSLVAFFMSIHVFNLWDRTPANELIRFWPDIDSDLVQVMSQYQNAIHQLDLTLPFYAGLFVGLRLLSGLPYFIISFLVVRRRSDRLMAILFAMAIAVAGAAGRWLAPNWMIVGTYYPWMSIPVKLLFVTLDCSVIIFFTFPDGRFVPRWTRWVALYAVLYALLTNFGGNSPLNPNNYTGLRLLSQGILVVLGVSALICRYRRDATTVQKQQLKWLVFGVVILGILYLEFYLTTNFYYALTGQTLFKTPMQNLISELITEPAWYIGQGLFAICIGLSIFRYHLWDIDLVINRVLVYGALTGLMMGAYLATVSLLGSLFRGIAEPVTFFVATGMVAILFEPLRQRLQRLVNRLMYGERDDPYSVLSRLSNALEHTPSPADVLPAIAATVSQALKIPYVAIQVEQNGADCQVAAFGLPQEGAIPFPMVYQGATIGSLQVAPRARGEEFSRSDRRLIENIARQAGTAAQAVRLNTELVRSRAQIITAREEERRRLRRDLHDGLGPILASQTLKMGAVRELIHQDPEKAIALIDDVIHQNENTISEVRRLVYDLRPPALDELGLVEAVRDLVRRIENDAPGSRLEIQFAGPQEDLPKLPAVVEVNAYRIASEALTNVARHSQAHSCHIQFSNSKNDDKKSFLVIDIQDDGTGIPTHYRAGVGLRSMRERAEEINGRLNIESGGQRGTRITAWLPLDV